MDCDCLMGLYLMVDWYVVVEFSTGKVMACCSSDSGEMQWIVKFGKHHPPAFEGTFDIQVAEDWINRLEKIFAILECPSKRKAHMVIYKLEGEANRWWRKKKLVLQANVTPITQEVSKEKFFLKYFPQSVRDEKEAKFLMIKKTVNKPFDEYLARYIKLSRYSTYLWHMNDELWFTEKIIIGLKPELREKVAPWQLEVFNNIVEVCRITENGQNHIELAKATP
ncbi:uncharacterized protein LOC114749888 [Neltuma alba]|uniref:uncharacterized protein LOC114749888 n=1 Tax=Neltuma alba TaxID=207710 RepID=UPI0010A481FB|nr:uncharacterized protein LOC114749888 [Prosopis alba]